jgi:predicted DNA-binding transcriptional regulator YafY
MSDHFTVKELARHFNVNLKTIYRRLWAKGIPATRSDDAGGLPERISFG